MTMMCVLLIRLSSKAFVRGHVRATVAQVVSIRVYCKIVGIAVTGGDDVLCAISS